MDFKKKPNSIYILAAFVFIIWGAVFLRFFSFGKGATPSFAKMELPEDSVVKSLQKDFKLLLNYPDPFKSKVPINSSKHSINNNESEIIMKTSKPVRKDLKSNMLEVEMKTAPTVNYIGLFSNASNNKRVGIIEINNKRHILMEGISEQGIQIVKLTADSLVYHYANSVFVRLNQKK